MNRKQFLARCGMGLCACGAMSPTTLLASTPDGAKPAEDWRQAWAQKRYAKMLEVLSTQTSDETVAVVLKRVGAFCASQMKTLANHSGDVDGFIREFSQRYNEEITFDREKGVISVVGPERTDCFCPLVCRQTPAAVCNCSMGWQQHVYETLLGCEVHVELKESVLRGGRRCVFEIRIVGTPRNDKAAAARG